MINENNWFEKYQLLSDDEKDVYKEFMLDTDKRAIILDYERFINAIELIASNPNDLLAKYNKEINVAEEVALIFDDECVYIAPYLLNEKCISEEVYNLVMKINEQLALLSNEHNEENWTIQAMNSDKRWTRVRALATELVSHIL
ncbi:MAG: hypothetical protein HDR00_10065 [Lachnospiraceae bacterium]|nr:hypothetical protein [Lachnospiraceae bacterium]